MQRWLLWSISLFPELQLRGLVLRKSSQVFHDRSLPLRNLWTLFLSVLEYFSPVWCSAAYLHLTIIHRLVRSAEFSADGVLECNLAHWRPVAVLCMLFKIKSNPMHPLSYSLPLPYEPARVALGASVAHRPSFTPTRCRTSQYAWPLHSFQYLHGTDLNDPVFDGMGTLCT